MERYILVEKRKLIVEDITFKASRMIKENEEPDINGMTEVPTIFLKELDDLMQGLDKINGEIEDTRI